MAKKDFLQEKYEEINKLKNLIQTYPKEYSENIIKAMNKIFNEINEYLEKEKKKSQKNKKREKKREVPKRVFTIEELAKYNGKDGNPSYAAVNGVVYDLSKILQWKDGNHYGLLAGQDLTNYFGGCHSQNTDILNNAIAVGTLKESIRLPRIEKYSMEQIAKFDGKNGRAAYVVVNGTVYDVSSIDCWKDGKHYGLVAGKDLTEFFESCHPGEKHILYKMRVVGTLVE